MVERHERNERAIGSETRRESDRNPLQQGSRGTHTMKDGGGYLRERGLVPMNDLPAMIFHLPGVLEHVEERAISVVAGGTNQSGPSFDVNEGSTTKR